MDFLMAWQESAPSAWVRESSWALFTALILHTISMGFLLGAIAMVDLRVLGLAATGSPLSRFGRLYPFLIANLGVMLFSGLMLVMGYPAKAILNPLFYVKLSALIAALLLTRSLWTQGVVTGAYDDAAPPSRAKTMAMISIGLMLVGLFTGKLLAHTAKVTMLMREW